MANARARVRGDGERESEGGGKERVASAWATTARTMDKHKHRTSGISCLNAASIASGFIDPSSTCCFTCCNFGSSIACSSMGFLGFRFLNSKCVYVRVCGMCVCVCACVCVCVSREKRSEQWGEP
jgi:hypothetical protein